MHFELGIKRRKKEKYPITRTQAWIIGSNYPVLESCYRISVVRFILILILIGGRIEYTNAPHPKKTSEQIYESLSSSFPSIKSILPARNFDNDRTLSVVESTLHDVLHVLVFPFRKLLRPNSWKRARTIDNATFHRKGKRPELLDHGDTRWNEATRGSGWPVVKEAEEVEGRRGGTREDEVKEEEVNVEKPRRNPRRRCIDSAANSPAYPTTTTDFQERSLSLGAASLAGHAHTTQRFYHLLHLHQLLILSLSLSLSSLFLLPRTRACTRARTGECERTYGRSTLADVFKNVGSGPRGSASLTGSVSTFAPRTVSIRTNRVEVKVEFAHSQSDRRWWMDRILPSLLMRIFPRIHRVNINWSLNSEKREQSSVSWIRQSRVSHFE